MLLQEDSQTENDHTIIINDEILNTNASYMEKRKIKGDMLFVIAESEIAKMSKIREQSFR